MLFVSGEYDDDDDTSDSDGEFLSLLHIQQWSTAGKLSVSSVLQLVMGRVYRRGLCSITLQSNSVSPVGSAYSLLQWQMSCLNQTNNWYCCILYTDGDIV